MAKPSYFGEKRSINNDPAFFNRIPPDEIRRNVKRIVRDIKYDNIVPNDYVYFTNNTIVQICKAEAYQQYVDALIVCDALYRYIMTELIVGKTIPNVDLLVARNAASNQQVLANAKAQNWLRIYQCFSMIENTTDVNTIMSILKQIQNINFRPDEL
jgi:hypothetical protein